MRLLLPVWLCLSASFALQDRKPDALELDSGRILKGRFESADEQTIKFRTSKGVQDVPRDECLRLHFARTDDPGAAEGKGNPRAQNETARRQQQQKRQSQQKQGETIAIPAGTPIAVSVDMQVLGSDPPGGPISGMISSNVKSGGRTVIPAGSRVFGRVLETGDRIRLEFNEINIWGQSYPISSTTQAGATYSRMNAGAAGAATGAIIGQRIDGSSGWNNGAWLGAFIGRAAGNNMQDYETVVEAGSVVEFRLSRPLRVAQ